MGLQNLAFNFIVEHGGKLAKSLIHHISKPIAPAEKGLKYARTLEADTLQLSRRTSEESTIMKKLFSSEFKLQQSMNKDGYYVTTVIDKKTGKPVKTYVKLQISDKDYEKWCMYVKNSSGEYKEIGYRELNLDRKRKKIAPGYMNSEEGNAEYSGIGLRLHQICIERMMQEGYENVYILSTANAFPFHYKSGFRVLENTTRMTKDAFETTIKKLSKKSGISEKELRKVVVFIENSSNEIIISSKTFENWNKLFYQNNISSLDYYGFPMKLSDENLTYWKELIKQQPILEH